MKPDHTPENTHAADELLLTHADTPLTIEQ